MTVSLDFIRHFLGKLSPQSQTRALTPPEKPRVEEGYRDPAMGEAAIQMRDANERLALADSGGKEEPRSPEITRLVSAYLNARAEEMLALLIEGLTREATRELRQAVEVSRETISAEIAGVKGDIASSQREFSRLGRELVRSGATLEVIQAVVLGISPAVERLGDSLQAELERERQLHVEGGLDGLDEALATLDGLEAGLSEGRELLQATAEAHRRLKDATVQRWWRAMGEATGIKRPLPEVPLAGLESLVAGLELTYRRLQDGLARRGVTVIEAVGKPFDPYIHEAVAVETCPEEQDGLVLREQRRGYRTSDRVVRLSQVVVGRGEAAKASGKGRRSRLTRTAPVSDAGEAESESSPER